MRSIYWLKNDLRLFDNMTLVNFCQKSSDGLIIWCPNKNHNNLSPFKKNAINESIYELNLKLKNFNQEIIVFNLEFSKIIQQLVLELQIQQIFFTEDYAFDEKKEESLIQAYALQNSIEVFKYDQNTLVAQADLPFLIEKMPLVFTDFRKKVEAQLFISQPLQIPTEFPKKIELSEPLNIFKNKIQNLIELKFSETKMLDRLDGYFWKSRSVLNYKETRNGLMNINDSTRFSVGLNTGSLSARTIYFKLQQFESEVESNESTYWVIFELLWRDYFKFFSLKYGHKIFNLKGLESLEPKKYKFSGNDKAQFLMWCNGETENRFINANMNELNLTGWMSNRGRQNVASYLIHDLKCPWTWGASYFQQKLVDYDPDLNWGNWLYLSGKGSDPRSRIFNCDKQANMYDPDQAYQNKWAP